MNILLRIHIIINKISIWLSIKALLIMLLFCYVFCVLEEVFLFFWFGEWGGAEVVHLERFVLYGRVILDFGHVECMLLFVVEEVVCGLLVSPSWLIWKHVHVLDLWWTICILEEVVGRIIWKVPGSLIWNHIIVHVSIWSNLKIIITLLLNLLDTLPLSFALLRLGPSLLRTLNRRWLHIRFLLPFNSILFSYIINF